MSENDRSSASNPLKILLHVNGPKDGGDRPRDVAQVVMRFVCESDNGCMVEGHKLVRGENFAVIYEDRVDAVMKRVRTTEHVRAIETAKTIAGNKAREWIKERSDGFKGSDEDRRVFMSQLDKRCPHHWAQELAALGYRSGVPPLSAAEIVRNLPAPRTAENATREAHSDIAKAMQEGNQAMVDALKALAQASTGRQQKG
jgi:hypothetical protein